MGTIKRRAITATFVASLALAPACALKWFVPPQPAPLALRSTVVAADGTRLASLFVQNRKAVPARAIPSMVKAATVAAEDARFFTHAGIDVKGVVRALIANMGAGRVVQGGSTITEQLAKLMYGSNAPRSFGEKLREARLAGWLESRYTKDTILSMYLNRAYFGHGAYGIGAAVETYFGVPMSSLDPARAALLAGLLQAPTVLDPFGHPEAARARRNAVLERMRKAGSITPEQASAAVRAPLGLRAHAASVDERAPYGVAQFFSLGIGIFLIVIGAVGLARAGINHVDSPTVFVGPFTMTPLLAAVNLVLGLIALIGATGRAAARGVCMFIGPVMIAGGIVALIQNVHVLGWNRADGAIYIILGAAALIAAYLTPIVTAYEERRVITA